MKGMSEAEGSEMGGDLPNLGSERLFLESKDHAEAQAERGYLVSTEHCMCAQAQKQHECRVRTDWQGGLDPGTRPSSLAKHVKKTKQTSCTGPRWPQFSSSASEVQPSSKSLLEAFTQQSW